MEDREMKAENHDWVVWMPPIRLTMGREEAETASKALGHLS
jgi:hypothetical protein